MILLAAAVRCLQWLFLDHQHSGFIFKILAHTGGVINGSMGPFVVTLPSVVSSAWFPPHQRTMATGISWLLLESGNSLGFIIGNFQTSRNLDVFDLIIDRSSHGDGRPGQ